MVVRHDKQHDRMRQIILCSCEQSELRFVATNVVCVTESNMIELVEAYGQVSVARWLNTVLGLCVTESNMIELLH